MFAGEDLIQVKAPKGSFEDKKSPTWFVPAHRLDEFAKEKEKNIVERVHGKPRIYKKGAKEFREARKIWDGHSPLSVSWQIDNGHQTVTKPFFIRPFGPLTGNGIMSGYIGYSKKGWLVVSG
jgi:hypothetical protein